MHDSGWTHGACAIALCGLCGCAVGPAGKVIDAYPVAAVALSPDGASIAAGTTVQGIAYLLDSGTRRIRFVLTTANAVIDIRPAIGLPVAFSPDGASLATAGMEDGVAVHIWNVASGTEARRMAGARSSSAILYSPDGSRIFTSGPGDLVSVWSARDGLLAHQWRAHAADVLSLAFSPDGSIVISGGADGSLKFWSASDFALLGNIDGLAGEVTGIAFSPDGRRLGVSIGGRQMRLFDSTARDGSAESRVLSQTAERGSASQSSLIEAILWIGAIRSSRLVGAPSNIPFGGAGGGARRNEKLLCYPNIAFSRDGKRVASVVQDAGLRIQITDLETGAAISTDRVVGCKIAFSADGLQLIGGGFNASVRVFDPVSGQRLD